MRGLLALALACSFVVVMGARPALAGGAGAEIGMPFSGWWDRFGVSHPSYHGPSGNTYADWATDIYAAPGTAVRPRLSGPGLALKVSSTNVTCGSAGRTVAIDVHTNGQWVGTVRYGHLSNLAVSPNQWISTDTVLGTLAMYSYQPGCWEVNDTNGVHTHLTGYNLQSYSCYYDVGSGSFRSDGYPVGIVGGSYASGPRQRCSGTLDVTPPTINASVTPAANAAGWNRATVSVSWSCSDPSGIASCTGPTTLSAETGGTTVTGTAVDNAGNTATGLVTIRIDKTAPVIAGAINQQPNANGWHRVPVTIAWTCSDALSGLVSGCSSEVVSVEGKNLVRSWTAADRAGNQATVSTVPFSIDRTAPFIGHVRDVQPNEYGWYAQPVTVTWTCSDALSGLAAECPATTVLSEEGRDQSAAIEAIDRADNGATASESGINIDLTAPEVAVDPNVMPMGAISGAASDQLSGLRVVMVDFVNTLTQTHTVRTATLDEGRWTVITEGLTPGAYLVTANATDFASNSHASAPQVVLVLG
ncbi:MAG: M23 family metallopeptidase [Actinomycetota bacterium]